MIQPVLALSPIEMLLRTIFYQYLSNVLCLSIVSDQNLNANFFAKPLIYVNPTDNKKFAKHLINGSELGCSDYIIQMTDPEIFMEIFERNIHESNVRRSDRKLIFMAALNKPAQVDSIMNVLKMKGAQFVANILLIIPTEETMQGLQKCELYKLVTHKFVGQNDNHEAVPLDTWNSCTGQFESKNNLFPHDMSNLEGKVLKLACFTYKPYVLLDLDTNVVPIGYDGTEIRIIVEFCRWINCTIELIRDDDEEWGEIYENRTGNGVLGNLVEDRADIGISALYTWYHEYRFLDLSNPAIRTGVTCVAPAPRLLPSWELPVLPFSWGMWSAVVMTFVLSSLALTLAKGGSTDRVLLTTFGMLVTQSQPESATGPKTRFVVIWVLLTGLILDNAYGGGLASVFTVPKYEKSIDTVQDLVDADIKWGATHDAWIFSILLSTEPNMIQLVKRFTTNRAEELRHMGFSRDFAFGIERLPKGHYAIGEYVTGEVIPYLQLMQEDIYWEQCVMMARKSSPYTKKYNQLLSRLHSSGILLAWETQVVLQHSNYKVQLGVKLSQTMHQDLELGGLDLQDVMGIFILLLVGIIASVLTFIGELIYARKTCTQVILDAV